jgi:hypothetical protein
MSILKVIIERLEKQERIDRMKAEKERRKSLLMARNMFINEATIKQNEN